MENMIIGDRKIKMSDADFIELVTRLDNMLNDCPMDYTADDSFVCVDNCCECLSKRLSEFIIVE